MNSPYSFPPQPPSDEARRERLAGAPGTPRGPGTPGGDEPRKPDPFESGFQKLKTRLHRELIDSLDLSRLGTLDEAHLRSHIWNLAEKLFRSRREMLSSVDQERLIDELMAESFGLGPLEPYMQDPDVTDILVNGPNEVYVERLGRLQETNTVFADEEHLMQVIQRVVGWVGRRIDSPVADGRRPAARRLARQRRHPALGDRTGPRFRSAGSAIPRLDIASPLVVRLDLPGNGRLSQGGHRRPHQHHDQRRHGVGQDDDAQQPCRPSFRPTSGW